MHLSLEAWWMLGVNPDVSYIADPGKWLGEGSPGTTFEEYTIPGTAGSSWVPPSPTMKDIDSLLFDCHLLVLLNRLPLNPGGRHEEKPQVGGTLQFSSFKLV